MAVPKKKIPRSQGKNRTRTWYRINKERILNLVNLVKDKETGDFHLNHHVNPVTGKYKGRQVIDKSKEIDAITTIKA